MRSSSKRHNQPHASVATLVVASAVLHLLAVLVLDAGREKKMARSAAKRSVSKQKTALSSSCAADEALAFAARAVFCATPFGGGPRDCLGSVSSSLSARIAKCSAPPEDREEQVRIALVDAATLAKLKPLPILPLSVERQKKFEEQQKLEQQKKEEQVKKQLQSPTAKGQIVEITRPDVEMRPDKARYLSEYDSKVRKQTVARGSTEKMVARPGPKELPAVDKQVPAPKRTRQPDKSIQTDDPTARRDETPRKGPQSPGKLAMRRPGPKREIRADKAPGTKDGIRDRLAANGLAPRKGDGGRAAFRTHRPRGEEGAGGRPGGRPKTPDLQPSPDLLRRAVGGGSVDKIDDAVKGDTNALNTKKWKYASFFNRLKRQVAQNWHPDRVYLRRDPHGNVYGNKDRITVLRVSLKKDGSLARVFIQRASGVGFLDDEAVRAMRAAGPFPNPPGALADRRDKLITFSFGFHFQIGGRSDRWRIFRYR